MPTSEPPADPWYIVQQDNGQCVIVPGDAEVLLESPADSATASEEGAAGRQRWGPFASKAAAIARRVGLIRAGKCQPS